VAYQLHAGYLLALFIKPEGRYEDVPLKRLLSFKGLLGVIPEDKSLHRFLYFLLFHFLYQQT
jgi:hypothetical protein